MAAPSIRCWSTLAVCLTALSFAARPAHAQQPVDETLLFQDLSRVTGASRYEQDTREAPASITIITAEEMRRYGYRTLAEALATVRGFVVNDDHNYSYLGVRGFAVPGDFNSRVLFLVDGHRINESVYESALIGAGALIDLRLIERIEVVRGPASSLYGTSALFGVVNIVTRQGRWLDGVEMSASAAGSATYRASLGVGRRLARGTEVMAFGRVQRSAGQSLYFPELDAPATNDGLAVGTDGEHGDREFAKLVHGDLTLQAGRSARTKQIPTGSYQTLFNDPRAQTFDERHYALARFGHGFTDVSRLDATIAYDAYTYRGRYPYADGLFADYGLARWWSFDGQYVRPLRGGHRLVVGAEARWNTRQDQGGDNLDSGTVVFRAQRHGTVWALFTQAEWRAAPRLLVSGGVRHDQYTTFGGTTNPRVSVVYEGGRLGALKLLYGRAFRAPNAYELDYQDGGYSTKAPASLRPEVIESYEAVAEGVPLRGLQVTAAAFRLTLADLVTQVEDPADSLLVYRNVGRARSSGVEFQADARLPGGVAGGVGYTHQVARDLTTGAVLPSSPRHLATARFSVPLIGDRLRGSLLTRYASSQRTVAGPTLPGRAVTDVTLLGTLTPRLTFSATVYNLGNAAYRDPGGSEQVVAAIPQQRRSARIAIEARF